MVSRGLKARYLPASPDGRERRGGEDHYGLDAAGQVAARFARGISAARSRGARGGCGRVVVACSSVRIHTGISARAEARGSLHESRICSNGLRKNVAAAPRGGRGKGRSSTTSYRCTSSRYCRSYSCQTVRCSKCCSTQRRPACPRRWRSPASRKSCSRAVRNVATFCTGTIRPRRPLRPGSKSRGTPR